MLTKVGWLVFALIALVVIAVGAKEGAEDRAAQLLPITKAFYSYRTPVACIYVVGRGGGQGLAVAAVAHEGKACE